MLKYATYADNDNVNENDNDNDNVNVYVNEKILQKKHKKIVENFFKKLKKLIKSGVFRDETYVERVLKMC